MACVQTPPVSAAHCAAGRALARCQGFARFSKVSWWESLRSVQRQVFSGLSEITFYTLYLVASARAKRKHAIEHARTSTDVLRGTGRSIFFRPRLSQLLLPRVVANEKSTISGRGSREFIHREWPNPYENQRFQAEALVKFFTESGLESSKINGTGRGSCEFLFTRSGQSEYRPRLSQNPLRQSGRGVTTHYHLLTTRYS